MGLHAGTISWVADLDTPTIQTTPRLLASAESVHSSLKLQPSPSYDVVEDASAGLRAEEVIRPAQASTSCTTASQADLSTQNKKNILEHAVSNLASHLHAPALGGPATWSPSMPIST